MEDITTRAITIGVSVLIAVATISAVMTYYSTAQEAVRRIGSGTDIAGLYEQGIEDTLLKNKVTGVEVKNLINYFSNRGDAVINFSNVALLNSAFPTSAEDSYQTFIIENANNIISDSDNKEKYLKILIPSAEYTIFYEINEGIINIQISGGV